MGTLRLALRSSVTRALNSDIRGEFVDPRIPSRLDRFLPLPLRRQSTTRVPMPDFPASIGRNVGPGTTRGQNLHLSRTFSQGHSSSSVAPISSSPLINQLPLRTSFSTHFVARGFRSTAPQSAAPMIVIIAAKKAAQVASILVARFFRNRYRRKSDEEKARFRARLARHKRKFNVLLSALTGVGLAYMLTHLEKTPHTKRWR